jgi:Abortive infection alpha
MTDNLVPISDEQAKALQEAFKLGGQGLETARAVGGFLSKVLGTAPEDLIGLLFGDALHAKRIENLARLAVKTQKVLQDLGVQSTEQVPLSVAVPLLGAAADESRDELVDLWARLLATAMDPSRSANLRLRFIEVVKAMDPIDALVLPLIRDISNGQPTQRAVFASRLERSEDEIEISFTHLCQLGCTIGNLGAEPSIRYLNLAKVNLTAFGRELLRALN